MAWQDHETLSLFRGTRTESVSMPLFLERVENRSIEDFQNTIIEVPQAQAKI
jgi:hypothetical protein